MSPKPATDSAFDRAIAEIPSCALDEAGVTAQRARYARLAPTVSRVERQADAVLIEFREDFDRGTLDETLAVERECCPFLGIETDERSLAISVGREDEAPMLDVFAEALAPSR